MLTKVLVVRPIACYEFDGDAAPDCRAENATPCCAAAAAESSAGYEANGAIIAALAAALKQLAPLILQLIALFGQPTTSTTPTTV